MRDADADTGAVADADADDDDDDIHMQACLRGKLSERVGCRLPWDPTTTQLPLCSQLHEFRSK